MIALLVLAVSLWWGSALLRAFGVQLEGAERLVVGSVLGLVSGFWVVYLLAAGVGRLDTAVLVSGAGLLALGAVAARLRPSPGPQRLERWFVLTAGVVGVVLVAMNLYGVLAVAGDGNVVAVEHVWADTPFHASIVTSFAHSPNFPPTYPLALGEPLGYPFAVDFVTGALVEGGLGLRASFVLVNVLIQLAFFSAVALLARRLSGSVRAAVVATGVLFALGNLGWLAIPGDVADAGGVWAWLRDLPWSYTGDALGDKGRERLGTGVYLGNPTFIFFVPRRSGAFGLAAGASLLLLFEEVLDRRHLGTAACAGLLLGLMPRVHAHSVIAMLAFVAVWTFLLPWREERPWERWPEAWRRNAVPWILCGGVALAVALPQVVEMSRQTSGFVDWWFGWTGEPHQEAVAGDVAGAAWAMARFWVLNGGLLVFLLVPALLRAPRRLRYWYMPFAALWVFGNVVRAQPWEWDNNNFFVYWQFGTVILVAPLLADLLRKGDGRGWGAFVRPVGGGLLVAGLTLGGLLSFVYAAEHRQHLWTAEEVRFAEEVRDETPPDAVVLTANGHGQPVIALAGRQTYMGFPGWFVSHGLDWRTYEERLQAMYSGDVGLMRALGVDHVVLGPWERGFAESHGFALDEVFHDPDVFREVLRETISGREWELLRLRPATDEL